MEVEFGWCLNPFFFVSFIYSQNPKFRGGGGGGGGWHPIMEVEFGWCLNPFFFVSFIYSQNPKFRGGGVGGGVAPNNGSRVWLVLESVFFCFIHIQPESKV